MNLVKDFTTKSFCRTLWVSKEARDVWEKPLKDCSKMIQDLEIESVVEGHREATWQTYSEEEIPQVTARWAQKGLVSLAVKRVATFSGFAHKHEPPRAGSRVSACLVVARGISACLEFKSAFERGDHVAQGELLGFPSCCSEFFTKVWKEGYFDPMWQVAENSVILGESERRLLVKTDPLSNPILRYAGIRVGFHIPHSFSCEKTVEIGKQRMELAHKLDTDTATLLEAFLKMPAKWEVLHGIGVVRTPLFYLVVQSVPTEQKYTVEVDGAFLPKEGHWVDS